MEKLGELSDIDKKMMVIEPRISNNNFTFLKKHIENLTKKKPPKTCCARLDILAEFCTMYNLNSQILSAYFLYPYFAHLIRVQMHTNLLISKQQFKNYLYYYALII